MAFKGEPDKQAHKLKQEGFSPAFDTAELRPIMGQDAIIPHIPVSPVGRTRLIRVLASKFGKNFRMVPEAHKMLKEFDTEYAYAREFLRLKGVSRG